MNRFIKRWVFNIYLLGSGFTIILILLSLSRPTLFAYFNYKLYDEFLLLNTTHSSSDHIAIVDIDEDSLKRHGQWPWPRYKIAAMLDELQELGALAISLDMMFPEKDRTSINIIQANITETAGPGFFPEALKNLPDNDRIFADAISRSRPVLGYQFLFNKEAASLNCLLSPPEVIGSLIPEDSRPLKMSWTASQVICNIDILAKATPYLGFLNASPDRDGILRRVPLIIEFQGRLYPSLALSTVLKAMRLDQISLYRNMDEYVLTVGKRTIPLNDYGSMLVNYRGKGKTFTYIPAADLLAGQVPEKQIQDKIVFIGTSAAGFREFRATPVDPLFPGVEIHATIADNILKGDILSQPAYARGVEVMIALFTGFIYIIFVANAGAWKDLIAIITGTVGLIGVSFWVFSTKSVYFSPVLPLAVLACNFAILNLLKFWREENRGKQQNSDLVQAQAAIIESMASLTETRDPETGRHIKRTQEYVRLLANELKKIPKYSSALNAETIDLLHKSAALHDIGKVGVSDKILLKPGELSPEEFAEMKKHTIIGRDVIAATQNTLGNKAFLKLAYEIAYTHHEKWDGSGYPRGLKGEEIPLSGRLMAVADMYEALTTRRVYKPAHTHEEAIRIMTNEERSSFDPEILSVFIKLSDDFRNLAQKYVDPNEKSVSYP